MVMPRSSSSTDSRISLLPPVGRDGHWFVEIDADTDTLDEIEGAVAGWLRGIGELAATVYLDGRRTDRVRAQGRV